MLAPPFTYALDFLCMRVQKVILGCEKGQNGCKSACILNYILLLWGADLMDLKKSQPDSIFPHPHGVLGFKLLRILQDISLKNGDI